MSDQKPTPQDNMEHIRRLLKNRADLDLWKLDAAKLEVLTEVFALVYSKLVKYKMPDAMSAALMFTFSGPNYMKMADKIFEEFTRNVQKQRNSEVKK